MKKFVIYFYLFVIFVLLAGGFSHAAANTPASWVSALPKIGEHKSVVKNWAVNVCAKPLVSQDRALTCSALNLPQLAFQIQSEFLFRNQRLSRITLDGLRPVIPIMLNGLSEQYGLPAISNSRLIYYSQHGVAVNMPRAQLIIFDATHSTDSATIEWLQQGRPILNSDLSRVQWLEDLDQLDHLIRTRHVDPFWLINKQSYIDAVKQAKEYIQHAAKIEAVKVQALFESLVAIMGDGHSYVVNKTERFGRLPLKFRWFEQSFIVTEAYPKYAHLLGGRLTAINGIPLNKAFENLYHFIPVANSSARRVGLEYIVTYVGILYAAGVSKSSECAELSFTLANGDVSTFKVEGQKNIKWSSFVKLPQGDSIRHNTPDNGFTVLNKNVGYVRYNSVYEHKPGAIKALAEKVDTWVNTQDNFNRLIVDIRDNSGGNSYLNSPLLTLLSRNTKINNNGKLYVLTNRHTFSAAINFAGALEWQSAAIFVGEPPGDRPVFAGESGAQAIYELTHSRTLVSLSFSKWISTSHFDERKSIDVDFKVDETFQDYVSHTDAVLAFAVTHQPNANRMVRYESPSHFSEMSDAIGFYRVDDIDTLELSYKKNAFWLEIKGVLYSKLYCNDILMCTTDVNHLTFDLSKKGRISLIYNDALRVLKKLKHAPKSVYQAIQINALNEFKRIVQSNPTDLRLSGNNLGLWASKIHDIEKQKVPSSFLSKARYATESIYGKHILSWEK